MLPSKLWKRWRYELYLAAQDSEAESEAEAVSEAEAEQPQSPEINWRTRAEEFIRRVALRLVLQWGNQNGGMLPAWMSGEKC